ncbi:MAG: hypothetical protein IH623_20655 [Verrucomicrobia bacterium]|nr:hypothetical protein [Verrucomicrobiota bacterium]
MATASHIVRKMDPPLRRTSVSHAIAGGWQRIVARWEAAIDYVVPVGYEDETGFHYGEVPAEAELESCFAGTDFKDGCEPSH